MEVYIGKVLDTKGIKGDLIIYFFTTQLRCKKTEKLFFENPQKNINDRLGPYTVEIIKEYKTKKNNQLYLLKLIEINSINDAVLLKKYHIVKKYDILPENIFLKKDIVECRVRIENTETDIGVVESIIDVRNDYKLLLVKNNIDEIYIPFIKEVIARVDIENKIILVKHIDGIIR